MGTIVHETHPQPQSKHIYYQRETSHLLTVQYLNTSNDRLFIFLTAFVRIVLLSCIIHSAEPTHKVRTRNNGPHHPYDSRGRCLTYAGPQTRLVGANASWSATQHQCIVTPASTLLHEIVPGSLYKLCNCPSYPPMV